MSAEGKVVFVETLFFGGRQLFDVEVDGRVVAKAALVQKNFHGDESLYTARTPAGENWTGLRSDIDEWARRLVARRPPAAPSIIPATENRT